MIQEYRKASAEKLGFSFDKMGTAWFNETGKGKGADFIGVWQPDKDANQMLMVWELWRTKLKGKELFKLLMKIAIRQGIITENK